MAKKSVETIEENVKDTMEEAVVEKKTSTKKAAAKKTTKKETDEAVQGQTAATDEETDAAESIEARFKEKCS